MCVITSLLATCRNHNVNPRTYLNDIIARMPYMEKASEEELIDILPHRWILSNPEAVVNDIYATWLNNNYYCINRVGEKRSSFSPTFVFRPLTPPYVRFRIRRFRAFSSHDVWQVVFSYPFE